MMRKNSLRVGSAVACIVTLAGGTLSLAQTVTTEKKGTPIAPAQPTPAQPLAPAKDAKASGAASDSKQPAANAADGKAGGETATLTAVSVVVERVEGKVRARRVSDNPDAPWTLLKGGERLSEGYEFTIGFKAAVEIRVAGHQLYTFDQMGKIELRRALKDGEKYVTRIDLREGRVSFDVDSSKTTNDVKIETPDGTLAIKGTKGAIEVRPGFATRAYGALDNKGRIEVDYNSGVKAVMTGSETTDSLNQNPAKLENELASAQTPKSDSRDKDEKRLLKRTTSNKQDVELTIGKIQNPVTDPMLPPTTDPAGPSPIMVPRPGSVLHFDPSRGDLLETTPDLNSGILRRSFGVDPSAAMGGSAIINDPVATGAGRLVYLETSFPTSDTVRNKFSLFTLDHLENEPTALGQFTGDSALVPTLNGLGALGSTLYATGSIGDRHGVYRVDLSRGELAQAMDLGTAFEGALGGATSRGTLFGVVHDPGAASGAPLLSRTAIVEIDPRTNFLAAAYPGLNHGLGESADTSNGTGVELGTLQALTGLAVVNGGIIISGVSNQDGGRSVLLRYETAGGAARLADVRNLPESITHGLASEAAGSVAPSTVLTNPPGQIDRTSISAAFAELGYSQQAFSSGLVERLVRKQVVMTSQMPSVCAASAEIGNLRVYLQQHVGQQGGIGRAVADFHATLPMDHACGQ